MKFPCRLLCLLIALGATEAGAQLPSTSPVSPGTPPAAPVTHSMMLDVENRGAGGAAKDADAAMPRVPNAGNPATSSSSVTQTRNHATTLQITVRNLGRVADSVQLEWYFFAKQEGRGQKDYLFDSGSKPIPLQANAESSLEVTSKAAKSSTVTTVSGLYTSGTNANVSYSTSEAQRGDKISGWVVRIVADGKVLDLRGSDSKFEDMAKDPNALK